MYSHLTDSFGSMTFVAIKNSFLCGVRQVDKNCGKKHCPYLYGQCNESKSLLTVCREE